MDEIVKLVSAKVGLPEAQARQVVQLVLSQLKQYMPAPIAGQIDGLMTGKTKLGDLKSMDHTLKGQGAGNLASRLGGLFGRKK